MTGSDAAIWGPEWLVSGGSGKLRGLYTILPMPQIPTARSTNADQAIKLFCQSRSRQSPDFPTRGPFGGGGR